MRNWTIPAMVALAFSGCGSDPTEAATGGGITITSNQVISPLLTDFCTEFAGEQCGFLGGQRVKFSDGSALITGVWYFQYASGGGDIDTDLDHNTITIVAPPNTNTYQLLSTAVARGSGYRRVFLVYTANPETLTLYYDLDDDGVAEASDTLIATLSLT